MDPVTLHINIVATPEEPTPPPPFRLTIDGAAEATRTVTSPSSTPASVVVENVGPVAMGGRLVATFPPGAPLNVMIEDPELYLGPGETRTRDLHVAVFLDTAPQMVAIVIGAA